MISLPFSPQSELESKIIADPEFLMGIEHGVPRPGHPEGAVKWHIVDVLRNVSQWYADSERYATLRFIALTHDSFKYQVDGTRPKTGTNQHGYLARRFAEKYLTDAPTLEVIELHDEAYNAWQKGARDNQWEKAEGRLQSLFERLGPAIELYSAFYRCDNATGDKTPLPVIWFNEQLNQIT